jgi:type I restriction enzyme S subunit
VGSAAFVSDPPDAVFASYLVRLRSGADVDARFLFYCLKTDAWRHHIDGVASGKSAQPNASAAAMASFRIPVPDLRIQQAVAEVLGALDDKIKSNRQLIATSEAILDAEADRLDGERVPLDQLVRVSRETVDPSTMGDQEVDLFSIPAFDAGRRPERVVAASIQSGKSRVDGDAVLLSRLNPRFPRLWHVVPEPEVPALCSTEFMVLRPSDGRTLADVWIACAQPEFRDEMTRRATGTSGSHQRLRPNDVLAIESVDPIALGDEARDEAAELLQLVETARRESSRLLALIEALLPELLSGRLRVKDAKEVAEAVT